MPEQTTHDVALAQRLRQLIREHPQAEIARRCGVSPVNVHNYTRGTRIPAEFCCALAQAMQVNPNWLLLGEGATYLTQASAETSGATLNLLELVKSMNAAMRMRLGALVGKDYPKALRDLNDQLKAYLGLKEKVSAYFLPHYRRVVDDIHAAIAKSDAATAGRYIEAALSLTSLCEDEATATRLLAARALHSWLTGDIESMLELQGQAFMRSFAAPEIADSVRFERAGTYVSSLALAGYWRRARDIGNATLHLIGPSAQRDHLHIILAQIWFELGHVRKALRMIERVKPDREAWHSEGAFSARTDCLLATGLVSAAELVATGERNRNANDWHRLGLLTVAVYSEDEQALDAACRAFAAKVDARAMPLAIAHLHAPLLLSAMRGERAAKLLARFDKAIAGAEAGSQRQRWTPVRRAVLRAQLARFCGARQPLQDGVLETEQLLAAMPDGVQPRISLAAIHCRNARAGAAAAKGAARDKFLAIAEPHRRRLAKAAHNGAAVFKEFQTDLNAS